MSRFNSSGHAYGFSIHCDNFYGRYWRMHWVIDFYYRGDRLRYPRGFSRITEDEKAARRFCKKHNIKFPENEGTKW